MLDWFLSIFLEAQCPLCQRVAKGDLVCRDCDRQLHQCKLPNPKLYWQDSLPLFVWGKYDDILKRAIATMKYQNQPLLGAWLGEQLAQTWQRSFADSQKLTVIPIPMHPQKYKERGFNQAALIAKRFAQLNRFRYVSHALKRTKATKALFNLNLSERQQEIRQAFSINPKTLPQLKRQRVLLLDDIYTSGTTAQEVARTLTQKGISVMGIAAIATPKKQHPVKPIPKTSR
ncbi:hypothetical protein Lepto7376_0332 [[Leptolyngbya] sp. PCC 7376]|uniref:ComF family protein n=1 Tax=[Leptolyngbya] sp. PCC 7376 TaxID=111781 RepID=UPI00029F06C1|nr:ComF family protein [[Leptolyngbya] sp. PCC 7376]AFY36773.1 hypothetical protein Lepto7376_0332 [[Leptolyngbya] sp. PCC 7376]